jgi:hypothetical protein
MLSEKNLRREAIEVRTGRGQCDADRVALAADIPRL